METKPFSIQSPEQIAKDYGGNKQKIAEAMQMGVLDPTAGTLAGMFIDRMRNAAQTEATPQQSIAQQVFAPPAPVAPGAGLAATPQAAAMQAQMPPMPGGAPMGPPMEPPMGPPPAGLAAAPMPAPGMAAGGLTTLPLPNDMFDEPSYGGYAGGGLVAFAAGELVETGDPAIDDPENTIVVPGPKDPPAYDPTYIQSTQAVLPSELGGLGSDIFANLSRYEEAAPRETRRATEFQEYLDRMLSPEEQRARRQEDMWAALGQIGARMATTPGSLLQAASTGVAEALPGIREAASARRAEERGARQALMGEERTQNQEVTARANVALDMLGSYNTLAEALQNRTFENLWRSLDRATQERIARINAAAGIRGSEIAASASRYGSDRQLEGERIADTRGTRAATTAAMNTVNDIVRGDITYVSATPERKQLIYDAAVARTFPLYGLPVPQSSGGGGAGGAVNYEDAMAAARGQ